MEADLDTALSSSRQSEATYQSDETNTKTIAIDKTELANKTKEDKIRI